MGWTILYRGDSPWNEPCWDPDILHVLHADRRPMNYDWQQLIEETCSVGYEMAYRHDWFTPTNKYLL